MADRNVTTCARVRTGTFEQDGKLVAVYKKRCGHCKTLNNLSSRVCRGWNCGYEMRKPQRRPKLKRGSVDRLRADLAHASKKSDEWTTKVKSAVTNLHYWNRRERKLAAQIDAARQDRSSGSAIRAIKFAKALGDG